MKTVFKYFLLINILVLHIFTVQATTYYVSNNGNNSDDGSEANPWQTIQHAADKAVAGDRVIITAGEYQEYVILRKSGSAGKYITFTGENKATVTMNGNNELKSAFESHKSSYIKIENITIKNYFEEGIAFYGKNENFSDFRSIQGLRDLEDSGDFSNLENTENLDYFKRNIRLTNLDILDSGYQRGLDCYRIDETGQRVNDCWDQGIRLTQVFDFIIDKCYVYNSWANNIYVLECSNGAIINCTTNGKQNGEYRDDSDGITIQNSQYITIDNCIANYNYEDGIDVGGDEGPDIKHIRVSNCTANYNYDDGFCFNVSNDETDFDGYDVTFSHCLAVGNANHGLTCYQQPDDVKIVHNTIINNRWGLKISEENPKQIIIKNNIVSKNTAHNFVYSDDDIGNFDMYHNNLFPTDNSRYRGNYYTEDDPLLTNDFTLKENSNCINEGTALTKTTSAGEGKIVNVKRVNYFNDGFGVIPGTFIQLGDKKVQIASISLKNNTITLTENSSWAMSAPVSFAYSGNKPDLGWKEYEEIQEPTVLGDVNCDGIVDAVDALAIVGYTVGERSESLSCPLSNPDSQIYLKNADVNGSGAVDAFDALMILQCVVGFSNDFCPNDNDRIITKTATKRLKVHPNLFQDFVTVQYESKENSNQPKMAFISNINNQVVREIEIPNQANWSTVLNVADLDPGLYMMTFIDGMHYETLKLIKN